MFTSRPVGGCVRCGLPCRQHMPRKGSERHPLPPKVVLLLTVLHATPPRARCLDVQRLAEGAGAIRRLWKRRSSPGHARPHTTSDSAPTPAPAPAPAAKDAASAADRTAHHSGASTHGASSSPAGVAAQADRPSPDAQAVAEACFPAHALRARSPPSSSTGLVSPSGKGALAAACRSTFACDHICLRLPDAACS